MRSATGSPESLKRGRARADPRGRGKEVELELRSAVTAAVLLVAARVAAAGAADGAGAGYQRTIDLGARPVELQFHSGATAPGSAAVTGEGSVRTELPFAGQLVLSVPVVMGSAASIGNTQVAARYDLAREDERMPGLAVVARVDLPTAPSTRAALPGVRATVAKHLGLGPLEAVHLETDLSTLAPQLAPALRTALGASFRLGPTTRASLDLSLLHPSAAAGLADQRLAQLGLAQQLGARTHLQLAVGAGRLDGNATLRASLSLERRF